ncbi:glycosyltransferase family 61 protein [Nocardioides sp. SYSU DS0651]|uniref:glycosyltransferase family 61 protein n=1 Tax=Nocardioides sp. SYSU DS0651 TaxID=3415955 RepID=UPI003F4B134D
MSRLPSRLQPLWPVVKAGHRVGARVVGAVGRRTVGPRRGLPWTATSTSRETLALEPGTTRIHSAGPAQSLRRPMPPGDPAGLPFLAEHLEHTVPERYVLELQDGLLLGRHAAVVTAGGTLDMETSHYFGIRGWKEHPVFWNPRPAEPERVDGTVAVLAARGTGGNYYHFVTDALPRLGLLEQCFPDLQPDAWVLDRSSRYQRELLDMLGVAPRRVVEPGPGLALRAHRLLVPSLPNAVMIAPPTSTSWLRDRLPPRVVTGLPERIYLTRGSTPNTRRLVAEDAVRARLERRGFVTIDPGSLSVQEQIDHFAAARVVVAPHGAALTNLVFCREGVRVLELFAPGYTVHCYWAITANIADSRYRYLVARTPARTGDNELMQDIEVTPDEVDAALDALLED